MNLFRRPTAWVMGLAVLGVAGCMTPKIDWAGRVGNYTFDQAVGELGPPDKQAALTDGSMVADWLTRRGRNAVYTTVGGFAGGPGWPGYTSVTVGSGAPDFYLRLHFDPHRQLTAWEKFAR